MQGIYNLQAQYSKTYGPGDYIPNIAVTYWTFRIMTGLAFLLGLVALIGLWLWRRGILEQTRWFLRVGLFSVAFPMIAILTGWLFTETGRQPWVVFGLLKTSNAVSPSVGALSVGISLAGFTLLYGALAVITVKLMLDMIRKGPGEETPGERDAAEAVELSLATVY